MALAQRVNPSDLTPGQLYALVYGVAVEADPPLARWMAARESALLAVIEGVLAKRRAAKRERFAVIQGGAEPGTPEYVKGLAATVLELAKKHPYESQPAVSGRVWDDLRLRAMKDYSDLAAAIKQADKTATFGIGGNPVALQPAWWATMVRMADEVLYGEGRRETYATLTDAQVLENVKRNAPGASQERARRAAAYRAQLWQGLDDVDFGEWMQLRMHKRQPWPIKSHDQPWIVMDAWREEAHARGIPSESGADLHVAEQFVARGLKARAAAAPPPSKTERQLIEEELLALRAEADELVGPKPMAWLQALVAKIPDRLELEKWQGYRTTADLREMLEASRKDLAEAKEWAAKAAASRAAAPAERVESGVDRAMAQLKAKGIEFGDVWHVPPHGRPDDTFQEDHRWFRVLGIDAEGDDATVETQDETGVDSRKTFTVPIRWVLDQPAQRTGSREFPQASGNVRLRDLVDHGAGPQNRVIKAVLEHLAPGSTWTTRSSKGTGYGWTHVSAKGGDAAKANAAAKAMGFTGNAHGGDALSERYHLWVPVGALDVARKVAARAKELGEQEEVERPAPARVWAFDYKLGDVLIREGQYVGQGVVDVVRVVSVSTGPTGKGPVKVETDPLALSQTMRGSRSLKVNEPAKGPLAARYVEAPDFTTQRLKERGGDILKAHAPELVPPGTRVLYTARPWVASPPEGGWSYMVPYAIDVSPRVGTAARVAPPAAPVSIVEEGRKLGAIWVSPSGYVFAAPLLKGAHEQRRETSGKLMSSSEGSTDLIAWVRGNSHELGEQLVRAAKLSAPPTVEEVEAAAKQSRLERAVGGEPGLVVIDPTGGWWFEPDIQTHRDGSLKWRQITGAITYQPGEWRTVDVLREVTDGGRRTFRLATVWDEAHVGVGSGGYRRRGVFVSTPSLQAPKEVVSYEAARKQTKRDAKDEMIAAFREKGWVYSQGGANEYVTHPGDAVRLQIRARTLQSQRRGRRSGSATGSWLNAGSEGTVDRFVEKLEHNVDRLHRWGDKSKPPRAFVASEATAKAALEKADMRTWGGTVEAWREGHATGLAGDPVVPIPIEHDMSAEYRQAWQLGHAAGEGERAAQAAAPVGEGSGVAAPAGKILLYHNATEGTIAKGDTRPVKDVLKRFGFRWFGRGGFWYVPNSRGKAQAPVDLVKLAKALGVVEGKGADPVEAVEDAGEEPEPEPAAPGGWGYNPGDHVQAPLSYRDHYVISHRPDEFTLSYRPPGEHHHVGTYTTLAEAKQAAAAHETQRVQAPATAGDALRALVEAALAAYGASLTASGNIAKGDKVFSVRVATKGAKMLLTDNSGKVLASGPIEASTVEKFVEEFWYWKKQEGSGDPGPFAAEAPPAAPADRYTVTDARGGTYKVWELTDRQYKAMTGVHVPYIAEISPMQYAGLSGREKRAYDKRREGEWQASADASNDYRALVLAARAEGLIDEKTPGLTRGGFGGLGSADVLWGAVVAEDKAAKADRQARLTALARIVQPSDVPVGTWVHQLHSGRYGQVVKHFGKSVRLRSRDGSEGTWDAGSLVRLHYGELVAAAEAGAQSAADLSRFARLYVEGLDEGLDGPAARERAKARLFETTPPAEGAIEVNLDTPRFRADLPAETVLYAAATEAVKTQARRRWVAFRYRYHGEVSPRFDAFEDPDYAGSLSKILVRGPVKASTDAQVYRWSPRRQAFSLADAPETAEAKQRVPDADALAHDVEIAEELRGMPRSMLAAIDPATLGPLARKAHAELTEAGTAPEPPFR